MISDQDFHAELLRRTVDLHDRLLPFYGKDSYTNFHFHIYLNGAFRPDSKLQINYHLSDSNYPNDCKVEGADYEAVVQEFMRRKGWIEQNASKPIDKQLPAPAPEIIDGEFTESATPPDRSVDDDIPF